MVDWPILHMNEIHCSDNRVNFKESFPILKLGLRLNPTNKNINLKSVSGVGYPVKLGSIPGTNLDAMLIKSNFHIEPFFAGNR